MAEKARITVLIPCRNEIGQIEACIGHILNNDYGAGYLEILVADGMSDDGTRERVQTIAAKHPQVKLLDNSRCFTPFAFNIGIVRGTGSMLAIVGARQLLAPDYLSTCVDILNKRPEVAGVGGQTNHVHQNEKSRLIAQAMESSFGVGMGNFRTKQEDGYMDTIGTPVYRMSVFDEVGHFDEALVRNQDDEFNFRVLKAGHKLWFTVNTSLRYFVRSGYGQLSKQYRQYGYWKVYVGKKHKAVTTFRQLVPFLWVLFTMVGFIAALFHPVLATIYAGIWALYLLLGGIMAFRTGRAGGFKVWGAYFVLHFSYGWGYLSGCWDFLLLGRTPRASQKSLSR